MTYQGPDTFYAVNESDLTDRYAISIAEDGLTHANTQTGEQESIEELKSRLKQDGYELLTFESLQIKLKSP